MDQDKFFWVDIVFHCNIQIHYKDTYQYIQYCYSIPTVERFCYGIQYQSKSDNRYNHYMEKERQKEKLYVLEKFEVTI